MIDHLNAYALAVNDVRICADSYRAKLGLDLKELEQEFAYPTLGPKGNAGLALVSTKGFERDLAGKQIKSLQGPFSQLLRRLSRGHGPSVR